MSSIINIFSTIGISDIADILIVTFFIYKVTVFVRKTSSSYLARGIFVFLAVLVLSEWLNLRMINYLAKSAVQLGVIALVVLFQPELRHFLERLGSTFSNGKAEAGSAVDTAIAQTVLACKEMSDSRTGALIIFERNVNHREIMRSGTMINADVTAELLKNMFFNKAPLHDGAVIIVKGRLAAAGCVLPLTRNNNISKELGTRHRAGIGVSEQSDAVAVIVSEETGAISIAIEGMLKRHLTPQMLEMTLRAELLEDDNDTKNVSFADILRRKFVGGKK